MPVPSSTDTPDGDVSPGHPRRWPIFVAVGLLGLAVDQVSKAWVVANWTHDVELVGSLLTLHLTYNPGAAFSTGTEFTYVISCVAIIATVVVCWLGFRVRNWLWALGFGFLLAGVTGNLADRLFREPSPMRGHVVDFLQLPHWPIFNIADICINVAAVIIILQSFRGVRMDGTRVEPKESADADATPTGTDQAASS